MEEQSEEGETLQEAKSFEEEEELNMIASFSTNNSGFELEGCNARDAKENRKNCYIAGGNQQSYNVALHKHWRDSKNCEFEPVGNKKVRFDNNTYRRMRSASEDLSDFSIINFMKLGRNGI